MSRLVAFVLVTAIVFAPAVCAEDSNANQQEKDLEQKQRIYGNKYPWENTAPYGTQYTPPPSGGGAPSIDSGSSGEPTKPAAKPAAKATEKVHTSKRTSHKAKKVVKHTSSH